MRRWLVIPALFAVAVVVSKLLVEDVLGVDAGAATKALLTDPGPLGATAVVTLLAVDLFLPVPSSIVMILSGAAFGIVGGAALSLVGSIGGEWLGFELVRRYGRRASARLVGDDEIERLGRVFARYGAVAVAVTRAVPVVMETMTVVAGLSTMSRGVFLLASLIGTGPIVLVYAYAGAASRDSGSLVPAVVILIAVAASAGVFYRARFERAAEPDAPPPPR